MQHAGQVGPTAQWAHVNDVFHLVATYAKWAKLQIGALVTHVLHPPQTSLKPMELALGVEGALAGRGIEEGGGGQTNGQK